MKVGEEGRQGGKERSGEEVDMAKNRVMFFWIKPNS